MSTISECVCPAVLQLQHVMHVRKQSQVNNSAAYSRLALLTYELLLNAGREKELIWEQKWRTSTIIYFFTRYPVFAFQIFNVYASAYTSDSQYEAAYRESFCPTCPPNCDVMNKFTWALTILPTRLAITASFVLRVYAILGLGRTGWIMAIFLTIMGLSTIGLDIWQDIQISCSNSSNPISTILTFFLLAAFDAVTTVILALRSIALFRGIGWRILASGGIVTALIRQGVIYFFTVTVVQLVVILLYYLPQSIYSLVLNNYSLFLSSILVSRFLLDLRELHCGQRTMWSVELTESFAPVQLGTESAPVSSWRGLADAVRDFEDVPSCDSMEDAVDLRSFEDQSQACVRCNEAENSHPE